MSLPVPHVCPKANSPNTEKQSETRGAEEKKRGKRVGGEKERQGSWEIRGRGDPEEKENEEEQQEIENKARKAPMFWPPA